MKGMTESRQKTRPKDAVIVVNWNGERFLERCLSALMVQTVKLQEIVVVDNASSDGSLVIARQFPSVRLIAQEQNSGFARDNNLAIEAASGESEWIALINPDAFVEPRWLEVLLTATEYNPEFDVFGSKLVNAADSTLLDGAGYAYHISGLVWPTAHGVPVSTLDQSECGLFSPCAAPPFVGATYCSKRGAMRIDFAMRKMSISVFD